MSRLLIQKYLNELAKLRRVSGSHRESVVREAFKDLLKNFNLLGRVTTVSVETVRIVAEMRRLRESEVGRRKGRSAPQKPRRKAGR